MNKDLLSREQKKIETASFDEEGFADAEKKLKRQQAGKLHSAEIKKLNTVYTKRKAAFGSVAIIKEESGFSHKKIEKFLQ